MSKPSISLHITIVGAGIAGLATAVGLAQQGHKVQVLESSEQLSEFGAGIQVPPNAVRILDSWGLRDKIYDQGTRNVGALVRRFDSGKVIGQLRGNYSWELYQYYHMTIHRADLQRILYDAALEAGAVVQFNKRVTSVDTGIPSLTLRDGSIITADLIIGADGIGSKTRSAIFPEERYRPQTTSECTYRIVLHRDAMLKDPRIAHLVETHNVNVWVGPGQHVVAYTIRGLDMYNMVFCGHGAAASVGNWNEPISLSQVSKEFSHFDPILQVLLQVAETAHKWMIAEIPKLPSWSNVNGRVVLLGDAAHGMKPSVAQGGAQCFEDAAVISSCLSRASSLDDVSPLVKAYENIRKQRAERVSTVSTQNSKTFQLPDGPEQEARDARLRKAMEFKIDLEAKIEIPEPNSEALFGTPPFMMWLYGYNCFEDVRRYFSSAH